MGHTTQKQLWLLRQDYLIRNYEYQFCHHTEFNFKILDNIMYITRSGNTKQRKTYNNCIIMCDTETSKKSLKKASQKVKLENNFRRGLVRKRRWTHCGQTKKSKMLHVKQ